MRRNKRRDYDEDVNHDRWLVSYADFITTVIKIISCFFVCNSVFFVMSQNFE